MSSLNTLDNETKKLLTLDNFLGNLTIPEFIEKLSKDLSLKGASLNDQEYLDPKPYIRTFEATLKELNKLNDEIVSRKEKTEEYVNSQEVEHSKNVLRLNDQAQRLNVKFSQLENRVSSISQVISPLRENLTKVNVSKENSSTMILLTRCYNEFYKHGVPPDQLLKLQNSSRQENKRKAAETIAKLMSLSKKLESDDLPNSHECNHLIQQYGDDFEKSLLATSAQHYKDKAYQKMKLVSDILFDYNDGQNLVNFYINQHPFFNYSLDKWVNSSTQEAYWMQLANADFVDFSVDEATSELTAAIAHVTNNEYEIVKQIFGQDHTKIVLETFIYKCFNELLLPRITYLTRTASSTSNLAEVRTLHLLYTDVNEMCSDIKKKMTSSGSDLNFSVDQNMSDLFSEFLVHDKYLNVEKRSLSELVYAQVSAFDKNNEKTVSKLELAKRIKSYQDMRFEFRKQQSQSGAESDPELLEEIIASNDLESELDGFSDVRKERHNPAARFLLSRYASSGKASGKRFAGISIFKSKTDKSISFRERLKSATGSTSHARSSSQPVNEIADLSLQEDYSLSLTRAEKILKYAIEALTRSVELVPGKSAEHAIEIFEILLLGLGNTYVTIGLEASYTKGVINQKSSFNYSNPLDLSHLNVIEDACGILYFFSMCVQKIFFPLVSSSQSPKSRLVALVNGYLSNCELGLDLILKDTAELVNKKTGAFLGNQSNEYFQQRDITHDTTPTCAKITAFLQSVHSDALKYLPVDVSESFLLDIGNSLLEQFLSNLKRFRINSIGGVILTQDTIHYVTLINSWGIESLSENFQVIREVANLFAVQPELLPSLIKEGKLAELRPHIVKKFISQRSDYKEGFMQ